MGGDHPSLDSELPLFGLVGLGYMHSSPKKFYVILSNTFMNVIERSETSYKYKSVFW